MPHPAAQLMLDARCWMLDGGRPPKPTGWENGSSIQYPVSGGVVPKKNLNGVSAVMAPEIQRTITDQ